VSDALPLVGEPVVFGVINAVLLVRVVL